MLHIHSRASVAKAMQAKGRLPAEAGGHSMLCPYAKGGLCHISRGR